MIRLNPENQFEKGPERIPTKDEVVEVISRFAEGAVLIKESSDEQGPYLIVMKVGPEKPGEFEEYVYERKGIFPGDNHKNASATSSIYVTYYLDDFPCGGTTKANYNPETGEWEEVK